MNAVAQALALLTQLLNLVPTGTQLYLNWKAQKEKLEAMYAKGPDYVPTDAEWDELDAATTTLEARIDANAARAAGAG